MAKRSNNKGPARKHIHMAAEARKDRNKQLYFLALAVVCGIMMWAIFSFTPVNQHNTVSSILIFGTALIVVIFIGEVGNRFTKYNNAYKQLKNEYGITEEQVKAFLKENK